MEFEDIFCDLEYAVKLKHLGLQVNSLFAFDINGEIGGGSCHDVNAYSVAELGEILAEHKTRIQFNADKFGYSAEACCNGFYRNFSSLKEANARAKLLIWLIENKYVKVGEL